MAFTPLLPLASIDAMRPVFMIVMGLALLLVAWRLTRHTSGWAPRITMAGALLLAFGYAVILPLYSAKVICSPELVIFFPGADKATMLGWNLAKIFAMNGGWLLLGLGLAIHARVFETATSTSTSPTQAPVQTEPSLG